MERVPTKVRYTLDLIVNQDIWQEQQEKGKTNKQILQEALNNMTIHIGDVFSDCVTPVPVITKFEE